MPADALTMEFEAHRTHLRGVAFRMLGSLDEADDAVQQAWLRTGRADLGGVTNLGGWLTTVVSRICLDALRARKVRSERPLDHAAEAAASRDLHRRSVDPAGEAELAESVGLAMLVVLDRLSPAERVAFVLHDLFALPFEEIARVVDRTPVTAKKLASRARAHVRADPGEPRRADLVEHARIVEAFRAAAAGGDVQALLRLLAPDVVRRTDHTAPQGPAEVRGTAAVAEETRLFGGGARRGQLALVDGAPGIVVAPSGRLWRVIRVTVVDGLISEYEVIGDRGTLDALDIAVW